MLCGHLPERLPRHFTGNEYSQLIIRLELARIIRSDTATALSAIAAGLSAAKTIILDLVRQMKEAVE